MNDWENLEPQGMLESTNYNNSDINSREEIIENVTIIYPDGVEENFDAIRITDKGVLNGKIIDGEFEAYGFIPKHSIKQINNGGGKKIDIKH